MRRVIDCVQDYVAAAFVWMGAAKCCVAVYILIQGEQPTLKFPVCAEFVINLFVD